MSAKWLSFLQIVISTVFRCIVDEVGKGRTRAVVCLWVLCLGRPVFAQVQTADNQLLAQQVEKSFDASLRLDHSFGTGNFTRNEFVREQNDTVAQTWDLNLGYSFALLGHRPRLSLRTEMSIFYTRPNTNPARRINPADTRLTFADPQLYRDAWSRLLFTGNVGLLLPTSYESLKVNRQYFAVRAGLGIERKLGDFLLRYGSSFTKNFNQVHNKLTYTTTSRPGDVIVTGAGANEPAGVPTGSGITSFSLIHSLFASYSITPNIALSYALLIVNRWKYNNVAQNDEFTSVHADSGRQRAVDQLWPTLELGWNATDFVGLLFTSPIQMRLSGGITALHPAQSDDNKHIVWPFFYQAFANNRAANNYGSIYVSVAGYY